MIRPGCSLEKPILDTANPVHAKFRDLLYQAVGIA